MKEKTNNETKDGSIPKKVGDLDQLLADEIIRLLWLAFNNFKMYGKIHPSSKKGAGDLHTQLVKSFKKTTIVTVHLEGDTLLCEKWRMQKNMNVQRLIERLKNAGIDSISFNEKVHSNDLLQLLKILADDKDYQTLEAITDILDERNVTGIQFNYFTYKKVSTDGDKESVVNKTETKIPPQETTVSDQKQDIYDKPLTQDFIVQKIREEFFKGKLSVNRLAKLIKQLTPDLSNLKVLLPQIKRALIANGMTFMEYLDFLHVLAIELELEGLITLLKKVDGNIGISMDEISENLKKDPNSAIPLIILTTNMLPLIETNRNQQITLITKNIELAVKNLALEKVSEKGIESVGEMGKILWEVENQFMKELEKKGFLSNDIKDIKNKLSEQIDSKLNLLWAESITNSISELRELSEKERLEVLFERIKTNKNMPSLLNPLVFILEEKGYSKEYMDFFIEKFTKTLDKIKTKKEKDEISEITSKKKQPRLPKGVLRVGETKKNLENEIFRSIRYNTPFSSLSIKVKNVNMESKLQDPSLEELAKIFKALTKQLTKSLRHFDLVGSLGSLKQNHLFIIMPMRDQKESTKIVTQLEGEFKKINIKIKGIQIKSEIILSSITFEKEKNPDMKSFLKQVQDNLKKKMLNTQND